MAEDRIEVAISRLTANEKECLRRRLLPQTAKEMPSISASPRMRWKSD